MPYKFIGLAGYGTRRRVFDENAYYLYDAFGDTVPAGSVNGSAVDGVGGRRTVADANGKQSVSSGIYNFATGGVANDWVYWNDAAFAQTAGRAFMADFGVRSATSSLTFGFDINSVAGAIRNGITITTTGISYVTAAAAIALIPITNTAVSLAIIPRATAGFWYFVKGGGLTNWTLLNFSILDTATLNIPEIQTTNTTAGFSVDNVRIPKAAYTIQPYTSDAFTAVTTDGNGHPEGGATSGLAYTAVGTWGVSGGACSCSALSGGIGFRYLPTSSPDVIVSCVATRSAGVMGVVARYEDASNYIIAYHDGTNFKIDKVVAGSTTNLSSQVRAYAAGANIRLVIRGVSAEGQYNFLASAVVTVPASTSVNHGLYTTNTGNTFDNLQYWPTGSEGQYEGLNQL